MIIQFWYLWLMVIFAAVLSCFAPKIKGNFGERSVSFFLSKLDDSKYKIINNLMLRVGEKTTQIDHIVVSNYGVFVIETKNYKGWIMGNEFDDYWKQVIYKRKEKLYNPIKQNYGHIKALEEVLKDYGEVNFISIVTFTTKADLKVTAKTDVVYTVNLPKTIRKYDSECISDSIKDEIYSKLISLNIDNKENRKAHVAAIKNNISIKSNKIQNNICPRCGGNLVIRKGKYGEFKGCSNYPKCRFTDKSV